MSKLSLKSISTHNNPVWRIRPLSRLWQNEPLGVTHISRPLIFFLNLSSVHVLYFSTSALNLLVCKNLCSDTSRIGSVLKIFSNKDTIGSSKGLKILSLPFLFTLKFFFSFSSFFELSLGMFFMLLIMLVLNYLHYFLILKLT